MGYHPWDYGWVTIQGVVVLPGLNLVSKVSAQNPKSIVNFLLVDFEWWVTILGMVGDHPWDGG